MLLLLSLLRLFCFVLVVVLDVFYVLEVVEFVAVLLFCMCLQLCGFSDFAVVVGFLKESYRAPIICCLLFAVCGALWVHGSLSLLSFLLLSLVSLSLFVGCVLLFVVCRLLFVCCVSCVVC